MLETEEEFRLKGDYWIKWFKGLLAEWKNRNILLPEGVELNTHKRLKASAVDELLQRSKVLQEQSPQDPRLQGMLLLLTSGVKAPTIKPR